MNEGPKYSLRQGPKTSLRLGEECQLLPEQNDCGVISSPTRSEGAPNGPNAHFVSGIERVAYPSHSLDVVDSVMEEVHWQYTARGGSDGRHEQGPRGGLYVHWVPGCSGTGADVAKLERGTCCASTIIEL